MSDAGTQGSRKAAVHGLTFALMFLILVVLQIVNGYPLEWIGVSIHPDQPVSIWMRIFVGVLPFAVMYFVLWVVVDALAKFISSAVAHGVTREIGETHRE